MNINNIYADTDIIVKYNLTLYQVKIEEKNHIK